VKKEIDLDLTVMCSLLVFDLITIFSQVAGLKPAARKKKLIESFAQSRLKKMGL
jgi:hypothetical protein